MLNKYMWQLYLKAGGDKTVKRFENNFTNGMKKDYADMITELHKYYLVADSILDDEHEQLNELREFLSKNSDIPFDTNIAKCLFNGMIGNGVKDNQAFDKFTWSMAYYSTLFSYFCPYDFVPYYFQYNYNVLEMIADTFGIKLPEIPKKADYKGRFFFYEKICNVLHEFRRQNELTPYELYAFLYDFAPKYIGGVISQAERINAL